MNKQQEKLQDWLPYWLEYYIREHCSSNTYANYYSYIHTHILPVLGEQKMESLTAHQLQRFIDDKLKNGRKDGKGGLKLKSVKEIFNVLNQALKRAVNLDMIPYNPCQCVFFPRKVKSEVQALDVKEQKQLEREIHAKYKPNNELFIKLGLYAGLRIGEVCALRVGDIDLENNRICVRNSLNRVRVFEHDGTTSYQVQMGTTKSKKQRYVPISRDLKKDLTRYLKTMPSHRKLPQLPLFVNQHGKAMEPRLMNYHFKRYIKRVGLSNIHFHMLRHTFATRSLEVGIDMKTLSKMMGHADVKITMDIYTHISECQLQKEMVKLTMKNISKMQMTPDKPLYF